MSYQGMVVRRSAPGAADPENLAKPDEGDEAAFVFSTLMAITNLRRGPNAVIPKSIRLSSVSVEKTSRSISLHTNVSSNETEIR